ncbi:hypothetical protein QMK19_24830 [Streptomyces sp. H10-C2]|uniref:hypothetical protein n=1 Tax=unclassified Streptomyces TaxID=2593676 RepID=UPI0024BB0494|nr:MULTISPECIES: hypothetical protein [unclassified Streptomyces]MDJ0343027.1 hypothetical protein [Streptomyces sp. PH10-H1]MDJ0372793.1 hypothetical protein [Streptomyces sp. H10-C2]
MVKLRKMRRSIATATLASPWGSRMSVRRATRRSVAIAAATFVAATALTAAAPTASAHAAGCDPNGQRIMLGPSTPVQVSKYNSPWSTIGYLYMGWIPSCSWAYAEIDWINGWQGDVSGSVYMNWNDPAHNSAEGRVSFQPGGPVSWVSHMLYEGPGTPYIPGRSFTAAAQITVTIPNWGFAQCGPKVIVGNTHDFSNGANSGVGDGHCHV